MTAPEYPAFDGTQVCAQVDPEVFHPDLGERTDAAKAICKGGILGYPQPCPFLDRCLDYALHHQVSGVWGGSSGNERRQMREKLGIKAEPLSFSSGPTNATIVKRMHKNGRAVADIAAHLGITPEAVRLVIRAHEQRRESEGRPPRPAPDSQVECPDCRNEMRFTSLRKHRRSHCAARQVAS